MREAVFIRQNLKKWRHYDTVVSQPEGCSPDEVAEVYNDLVADLAFAQTQYPNSPIESYLNNATLTLHNAIYRPRREKWSRVSSFWTTEVPLAIWNARRAMAVALAIFLVTTFIGMISTLGDHDFPRLILGDSYVDMTISNIENGDPAAVYQSGGRFESFAMIAYNNLQVSMYAFVLGIFTVLGPAYILATNGIMFGAFTTMFFNEGVLGEAMMAVMLHGTLELSTIVLMGGAGIVMGNGWLFPGTYSRVTSFRRAARRGLKIVVGAMPIVVAAAFVEGFFSRYTDASSALRLGFILISAVFVLFYYVYLPYRLSHATK